MKPQTVLSLFFFLMLSLQSYAQPLSFAISHEQEMSGTLEAWQSCEQGNCFYALSVMGEVPLASKVTSQYLNGQLVSATVHTPDFSLSLKRDDYNFHVLKNGDYYPIKKRKASFSESRLFFEEPTHETSVFWESTGEFVAISRTGPHQYEVQPTTGTRLLFSYQHGDCHAVEITAPGGTWTLRRMPSFATQ